MNTIYRFLCVLLLVLPASTQAACRSHRPVEAFKKQTGFPFGRPGYVVDHICSLVVGGIDDPINMQWQTIADSKVKDRWEASEAGKAKLCNKYNSTPTRQVFNCR